VSLPEAMTVPGDRRRSTEGVAMGQNNRGIIVGNRSNAFRDARQSNLSQQFMKWNGRWKLEVCARLAPERGLRARFSSGLIETYIDCGGTTLVPQASALARPRVWWRSSNAMIRHDLDTRGIHRCTIEVCERYGRQHPIDIRATACWVDRAGSSVRRVLSGKPTAACTSLNVGIDDDCFATPPCGLAWRTIDFGNSHVFAEERPCITHFFRAFFCWRAVFSWSS